MSFSTLGDSSKAISQAAAILKIEARLKELSCLGDLAQRVPRVMGTPANLLKALSPGMSPAPDFRAAGLAEEAEHQLSRALRARTWRCESN